MQGPRRRTPLSASLFLEYEDKHEQEHDVCRRRKRMTSDDPGLLGILRLLPFPQPQAAYSYFFRNVVVSMPRDSRYLVTVRRAMLSPCRRSMSAIF